MLEILMLSIAAFVATNIDDFIVDIFFFASAESKKDIFNIILGKYCGIGILLLSSFMGALGLEFLPIQHIGLLGFVPIGLGIKEIFTGIQEKEEEQQDSQSQRNRNMLWNISLITIASGADNIGVYVPLFTRFSGNEYIIFFAVFMWMIAMWCVLGYTASKLPLLKNTILKYKKVIVPSVYILLGGYILFSGIR